MNASTPLTPLTPLTPSTTGLSSRPYHNWGRSFTPDSPSTAPPGFVTPWIESKVFAKRDMIGRTPIPVHIPPGSATTSEATSDDDSLHDNTDGGSGGGGKNESPPLAMEDALSTLGLILCPIAAAGFSVSAFIVTVVGGAPLKTAAVPFWITSVLFVESSLLGGKAGPHHTTESALVICVILSVILFAANASHAWPWSVLLAITYGASACSSKRLSSSSGWSFYSAFLSAFRRTSLVLLGLLCVGAAVLAVGMLMFKPEAFGTISTVTLDSGDPLEVFWSCEGGEGGAIKAPTYMIEGDSSHGAAAFWPLQRELSARGLRSCVFDKPGQGWSSSLLRLSQDLDNTMALSYVATGEAPPYRLVGMGDGGASVYRFALQRPADVDAIIFLDVRGDAVEWRAHAAARNTTAEAMMKHRAAALASRRRNLQILHLVVAPLGLGWFFFRPDVNPYAHSKRFIAVYQWLHWTGKADQGHISTAQDGLLRQSFLSYHGTFDRADPRLNGTPILQIISNPANASSSAAASSSFGPEDDEEDDIDCINECDDLNNDHQDIANKEALFKWKDRLFVASVTNNPSIAFCSYADCDDHFPLRYPGFVAEVIHNRHRGHPVEQTLSYHA